MFVRNFFTKLTPEATGIYAFFTGSVLGTEASFRTGYDGGTKHFYLQVEKGLNHKPFLRAKTYWVNGNIFMREVELYNVEAEEYQPVEVSDKDRAFLLHLIRTNSAVLSRARTRWSKRVESL